MLFEGLDTKTVLKIHGEEKYKEGRAEGLKKGRAEGIEISERKFEQKMRNNALAMKKDGVTIKNISQYTGLSVSTIRRLH